MALFKLGCPMLFFSPFFFCNIVIFFIILRMPAKNYSCKEQNSTNDVLPFWCVIVVKHLYHALSAINNGLG